MRTLVALALTAATISPALARPEQTYPPSTDPAKVGNVVKALGAVPKEHRVAVLGAGVDELGGWRYGQDVAPAFKALQGAFDPSQRKMLVLRELMMPLALAGCARGASEAIRLAPAEQGEHLRANCATQILPAGRVAGAPFELVALALVLEQRAKKGGYATEPLHKKALETLLSGR